VDADQLRAEVRDFLITRRGRITPAEAGLPVYGGLRRVSGLRREELAMLAGLSVEYYSRLERGSLRGVSDAVLEALARALRLSEAERAHLYDLARAANATAGGRRAAVPQQIRLGVQRILDAMTAPALASNARMDYLAANRAGRALYAPLFDSPVGVNAARFLLLDPRGAEFYPDWDRAVDDVVALLRTQSAKTPWDKLITDLIGELSARSETRSARRGRPSTSRTARPPWCPERCTTPSPAAGGRPSAARRRRTEPRTATSTSVRRRGSRSPSR
jgi:transcriptional regulator with XRE-family HTH domain